MDDSPASDLLQFCKRQAGESLRGVILYGPDRHSVLYAREDLAEEYTAAALAPTLEHLRAVHDLPGATPEAGVGASEDVLPAPATSTALYVMEGQLVMHHLMSEERGIAVVLETDAGRSLMRFVTSCLRRLHDEGA